MYRQALRASARPAAKCLRSGASGRLASRRLASTASPADKPRSWKSSALRWGLVVGGVYYYNTSSVFADEAVPQNTTAPPPFDDSDLPTIDSVIEEKRKLVQEKLQKPVDEGSQKGAGIAQTGAAQSSGTVAAEGSPEALEEEADQQGAFNPETGEINWDCPCLGGMAHGPCGEEFKTAFSCFVYSEEEPKGMDCIEKFQGMQECFRKYPEIYGAELADEDDEASSSVDDAVVAEQPKTEETAAVAAAHPDSASSPTSASAHVPATPQSETAVDAIPTKWDDATEANKQIEKLQRDEEAENKEKKE